MFTVFLFCLTCVVSLAQCSIVRGRIPLSIVRYAPVPPTVMSCNGNESDPGPTQHLSRPGMEQIVLDIKESFAEFLSARAPNHYPFFTCTRGSDQFTANMSLKSLLHPFRRHKRRPRYDSQCRDHGRISSIVRWFSRISRSCRRKPRLENFTPYLPHTVVTYSFGTRDQVFQLYFSHFSTGNPSIAVFSSSQCAADPITWRPRRVNVRHGWRKNHQNARHIYTARVIVGSGCQHDVSMASIHHWDPAWGGILLINWEAMYEDYFAQERMERKNERAFKITKRCNRLEKST